MSSRIALVEDDEVILQNYADLLRSYHFEVDTYATKEAALRGLLSAPPSLLILDITLNGERDGGFTICGVVRQRHPQLPIMFLTSHDGEIDKISGMRLGADEYITKDASVDYLIVRIESLFRRIEAYQSPGKPTVHGIGLPTGLELNAATSTATWCGTPIELTLTRYWMLADLYTNRGRVRSHDELMSAAKTQVEPNTVTAHVKAIRDAITRVDPRFACIRTERARGYRWVES
jgi:two-component system OmpR family response regulator